MSAAGINMDRARSAYRAGLTLLVVAAIYEAFARSGHFPPALLCHRTHSPDSSCCRTSAALIVPSSPTTYLRSTRQGGGVNKAHAIAGGGTCSYKLLLLTACQMRCTR